jgi:predicted DNA-binding transcriptional regulator AlpA
MELLSIKEAMARLKIKRTVLWQLCQKPDFPKLVRLTSQRKVFVASEIDAWIQAKIDGRDRKEVA